MPEHYWSPLDRGRNNVPDNRRRGGILDSHCVQSFWLHLCSRAIPGTDRGSWLHRREIFTTAIKDASWQARPFDRRLTKHCTDRFWPFCVIHGLAFQAF